MTTARPRRRWPRRVAMVALAGLLAAAAESGGEVTPTATGEASSATQRVAHSASGIGPGRSAAAPDGAGVPRMAIPDTPDIPDTVEVHRVDLLVEPPEGAGLGAVWDTPVVRGVEHATGLATFDALLVLDGEGQPVRVAAVDPIAFRPLTPEVTANAPGVWKRLLEGDVAVRHDVAYRYQLELGEAVELHAQHQVPVRVGVFASNGAPPVADVVVPWEVGEQLGFGTVNKLAVAVDDSHPVEAVAERIVGLMGGGAADVVEEPTAQLARITGGFEPFSYVDYGDGMIQVDGRWVSRWITRVNLPIVGEARCHRLMVPQLVAALEEIRAKGLASLIHRDQFAGCWMPRHIDWDPRKPISMHAWGLAVDINSQENWIGQTPQMDPRIVAVFERWGFTWGGRWARPDGMHFELRRLIAR